MNERESLTLLGLTEYEARAYRALLANHPVSAYRLGKLSSVPLSRVYEVVAHLVEKGAATVVPGEPARYVPVPPEILIQSAQNRLSNSLSTLQAELSSIYHAAGLEGSGWIRGERLVLSRLLSLIQSARTELLLAACASVQDRVAKSVETVRLAARRRIYTTPFGLTDMPFILLVDQQTLLIGRLGEESDALLSHHPILIRFAEDYFRQRAMSERAAESRTTIPPATSSRLTDHNWLDWEEEKQRRLLRAH
jgi:sugar-specific transcriptional regulator TrmB